MSLAIVYSRAAFGVTSPLVTVEVHLANGMAGFGIVGLPETAVRESRERVRSALANAHFEFPICRITVNLAPADLPKDGGRFDLPIAIGILVASGQIPGDALSQYEFIGELALSGELRGVRGVLPVVLGMQSSGRSLIAPSQNAPEAAFVARANVYSANHLLAVCAHLCGEQTLPLAVRNADALLDAYPDLAEVRGQPHAKRALEIAAAGRHSLLFIGPPGTGKTMLASRLPGILPNMSDDEALEVAAVTSISHQGFQSKQWKQVPFRAPHHSSSSMALVGGGKPPRPGEISLAHHGVLFLDELPEFSRHTLESLREPMEARQITISRAACQATFPACFQLIASMNPCPCGYAGSTVQHCQCHPDQIKRYLSKISGPLLDRLDMQVEVTRLPAEALMMEAGEEEKSEQVRARVCRARMMQQSRQGKSNALLSVTELNEHAGLQAEAVALLRDVMTKFNFSMRVYHRIVRLSRTIADVGGEMEVAVAHVAEALSYRCLDRFKAVGMHTYVQK